MLLPRDIHAFMDCFWLRPSLGLQRERATAAIQHVFEACGVDSLASVRMRLALLIDIFWLLRPNARKPRPIPI
eukprot:scaffold5800_cov189-Pinguiococcus_pyrenoidosus.AAC.1